jgi:hypothetical protein
MYRYRQDTVIGRVFNRKLPLTGVAGCGYRIFSSKQECSILSSVLDPDPHSIVFLDPDTDPGGVKSAKTERKTELKDKKSM